MEFAKSAGAFMSGPGLIPQLVLTIVTLVVFYYVFIAYSKVKELVDKFDNLTNVLVADTISSGVIIPQYPGSGYPLLYQSVNEANGLEYSFSMWIFVHPDTFDDISKMDQCGKVSSSGKTTRLKHIFTKGNKDCFPLFAPGIFLHSDKSMISIYVNSIDKWDNVCDVPNIPIAKWFHLVTVQKGRFMDVLINGNITVRHAFDTVPKINFGGIYIMQPNTRVPKVGDKPIKSGRRDFIVDGTFKGMMSRIKYFAFALNYAHIDSLYRENPSPLITGTASASGAIEIAKGQRPPYFYDNWWVNNRYS
jgi:hypothetical protein